MKRDGRRSEGLPGCSGEDHEEAEAHEGQVGCQPLIMAWRRGSTLTRMEALKTTNGADRNSLGNRLHACWHPRLGRGTRNQREQRQEGTLAVTNRRVFVRGVNP